MMIRQDPESQSKVITLPVFIGDTYFSKFSWALPSTVALFSR